MRQSQLRKRRASQTAFASRSQKTCHEALRASADRLSRIRWRGMDPLATKVCFVLCPISFRPCAILCLQKIIRLQKGLLRDIRHFTVRNWIISSFPNSAIIDEIRCHAT